MNKNKEIIAIKMKTKEEAIRDIEEYYRDADKCISEDEEYICGWKCAMLVAIEVITEIDSL